MIKGNPLKLMLQFAFPLLLGNLLQQTYNIIDAAIVGQILGAKALASVGASSSIQFLVLGFCMGSCTGFGVPVAKYFGAEKIEKMRDYIFNGAVLCAGIAVILTALCSVLCPQILHILSVPEDIYDNAYSYLLIIFLGIPFTILYNYLNNNKKIKMLAVHAHFHAEPHQDYIFMKGMKIKEPYPIDTAHFFNT